MGMSTFMFAGAHAVKPENICAAYDWLCLNIVQAILLILLMYLTGFCAGEVIRS